MPGMRKAGGRGIYTAEICLCVGCRSVSRAGGVSNGAPNGVPFFHAKASCHFAVPQKRSKAVKLTNFHPPASEAHATLSHCLLDPPIFACVIALSHTL